MTLTEEQKAIVASNSPVIIGEAFAGASKSTTAKYFCKNRPDKKILYLVYNSSMKKEAMVDFKELRNVTVKTTHGLAWFPFGDKYNKAQKLIKSGSYKVYDVNRDLKLDDYSFAANILRLWNMWLVSDHINIDEMIDEEYDNKKNKYTNRIKNELNYLWKLKLDLTNNIMVEHNMYLKEYYLSGYKNLNNYSVLILDECQDSSTIVQKMFKSIACEQKLAIGDSLQSIYGWNGAVNALQNIDGKRYPLTKSFRVHQDTADVCNLLFKEFGKYPIDMKGANKNQKLNLKPMNPADLNSCAVICRTNAMVFGNALELSDRSRYIFFEGGLKKYKFDFYKRMWYFRCGRQVNDPQLNKFENYKDLVEYAEESEDIELLSAIGIIKMYNTDIPDGVDRINKYAVSNKKDADHILTTAHSSKGQTYKIPVVIEDDFREIRDFEIFKMMKKSSGLDENRIKSMEDMMMESLNLIYVAITRSFGDLYINRDLINWLTKMKIKKEFNL